VGGTSPAVRGRALFTLTGCALCHTPSMKLRPSDIDALSNKTVNLFSDLLLHNMDSGLADQVQQGNAAGNEFRTAPLWGLGQRLFFLHDGRTSNLQTAIQAHKSPGSEATAVVNAFGLLSSQQQQDLLNFLRSAVASALIYTLVQFQRRRKGPPGALTPDGLPNAGSGQTVNHTRGA
jgi:CxxC motif-containing protein (DUF1111 family)